jgi:hypothetical protein
VEDIDAQLARTAGELCGEAGTSDAVDALVVASAARRGDRILTSDPGDLARLADHVADVRVIPI